MRHDQNVEAAIRAKFVALKGILSERARRLWAATESRSIGYGGDALVASATGITRDTIRAGREELATGGALAERQRRVGGGRKALVESQPGWVDALEQIVAPMTRGDPMSPLRWTCKSTRNLAIELQRKGFAVSHASVGKVG